MLASKRIRHKVQINPFPEVTTDKRKTNTGKQTKQFTCKQILLPKIVFLSSAIASGNGYIGSMFSIVSIFFFCSPWCIIVQEVNMFVPCILLLFFNLFIMMYYILWVCYCFRKWICLYLVYFFCSLIFFCSSWCIIASGSRCVCILFTSSFFLFVYHDVLSRQEVDVFLPCLLLLFSYLFIMMYYRVRK